MDRDRLALHLSSPDEEVRKEAVLAMTELGDPESIPALRRATADDSPAVRFFARRGIDRLSRQVEPEARDAWMDALDAAAGDRISVNRWKELLWEADLESRLRHVMATLKVTDPALVPLLLKRLECEEDVRVRASLVKSVGRFRHEQSFDVLLPFLQDPDPRVRANTVEALDDLGDPRLEPHLEEVLNDEDNRIRGNALKALARFDRPRAISGAHEMAASPHTWMRATAIWLLRELGGRQAEEALQRMRHRETGEMAEKIDAALSILASRKASEGALPELAAGKKAREAVKRQLETDDDAGRMEGIIAAAELPPAEAVPLLKKALLSESSDRVLATLVRTLGQVGGVGDVKVVAAYLKHEDARVRANAIEALAALGDLESFSLVEPLLSDKDQRVRANAAWLIHGREPEKAFATLKEMLLSRQSGLQDSAIYALREIGTEQVLEVFETALASDVPEVRIKILGALETWSGSSEVARKLLETYRVRGQSLPWVPDRLEDLIRDLDTGRSADRRQALEKLGTFREPAAKKRLERAATDADPAIRKRSREILRESEYEEAKREAIFRLGLAAYQWLREAGDRAPRELSDVVSRARQASKDMESGRDVMNSLSMRRQSLVELGQEVHLLVGTGQLFAAPLEEPLQELARIEMKQQVADMPTPRIAPERASRIWIRILAVVVTGITFGVGTYYLFKMPPSPNMKRLKVVETPEGRRIRVDAGRTATASGAVAASVPSTSTATSTTSPATTTTRETTPEG